MREISGKGKFRLLAAAVIICTAMPIFAEGQQDSQSSVHVPAYTDNGDGTVSDNISGLMWARDDSAKVLSREEAKEYAENSMYAGYDDWRLPSEKELQGIEAYMRENPASGCSVFNFTEPSDNETARRAAGERGNSYVRLVRGGMPGAEEAEGSQEQPGGPEGNHAGPRQGGDASGFPQGGPPDPPDFAAVAVELGINEEALMDALGDPRQGPPDFSAAAEKLGISEEDLMDALGIPEGGMPEGGLPPR